MVVRLRPTLPHRHQCSTIGAEGLSFRVRNGTGRFPFAMTAVTLWRYRRHPRHAGLGVGVSRPYLGNSTVDAGSHTLTVIKEMCGGVKSSAY